MPLELDISSNIDEFEREATEMELQQVPFAASVAINNSAKDVRRVVIGSTWPKAFKVRNKAFPGVVLRIKFSTKYDLEAAVFDQLGREYLERHTTGGVKRPTGGKNLAIPVNVPREASGRIVKSKKPDEFLPKAVQENLPELLVFMMPSSIAQSSLLMMLACCGRASA